MITVDNVNVRNGQAIWYVSNGKVRGANFWHGVHDQKGKPPIYSDRAQAELSLIDEDTLVTWLANATKTYYQANGHGKAGRNEQAMKEYREALRLRGCDFPKFEDRIKSGIFNGEGSK
jgi:hypothetical protein